MDADNGYQEWLEVLHRRDLGIAFAVLVVGIVIMWLILAQRYPNQMVKLNVLLVIAFYLSIIAVSISGKLL